MPRKAWRIKSLKSKIDPFKKYRNEPTFTNGQKLADKYNKVITNWVKINRGTEHFCHLAKRECSPKLAEHILKQVYRKRVTPILPLLVPPARAFAGYPKNRMSITDPSSLNKYESFSSETYGETNFKQMRTIIEELERLEKWKKNEVFVDLGSGIGSIVMQAAACCRTIKCAIGIEIQAKGLFYRIVMS